MSMTYWMCEGIGIDTDSIRKYLDKKKCIKFLRKQLPGEEINEEQFDLEDYLCASPFDSLGELLCCCDDTSTLTYVGNGDGTYYFYYTPSYPWDRKENEPQSVKEVHKRIIAAVKKICTVSTNELEKIINDEIYDYGCA